MTAALVDIFCRSFPIPPAAITLDISFPIMGWYSSISGAAHPPALAAHPAHLPGGQPLRPDRGHGMVRGERRRLHLRPGGQSRSATASPTTSRCAAPRPAPKRCGASPPSTSAAGNSGDSPQRAIIDSSLSWRTNATPDTTSSESPVCSLKSFKGATMLYEYIVPSGSISVRIPGTSRGPIPEVSL